MKIKMELKIKLLKSMKYLHNNYRKKKKFFSKLPFKKLSKDSIKTKNLTENLSKVIFNKNTMLFFVLFLNSIDFEFYIFWENIVE
jgi:hypothetical protein